jgi:hypothetical protein
MAVLVEQGFAEIADDFREARRVMFGDAPLNESTITPVVSRLLNSDTALEGVQPQINEIHDRLIEQLPELLERRDEVGKASGLFEPESGDA